MKSKRFLVQLLLGMVLVSQIMLASMANAEAVRAKYTTKEIHDGKTTYILVTNPNHGKTLGYSKTSGVKLLEKVAGRYTYAFKDLNRNGKLDQWEDWRLDDTTRAKDLASQLSIPEIAGLMLFSAHERKIEEGLTDAQKSYLAKDNLRAVLNAGSNNVKAAVQWNNEMQAYVEGLACPIPVNFSSDPRSTAGSGDQYSNAISGKDVSLWPSNLGLAATFDTGIMYQFAKMVSEEYRAMGIATALGPQIDLATEPRWLRVSGTFGEDVKLATDMTRAYVDGSQSTYDKNGKDLGWGSNSINCMIKHWPGDGPGEGGRESHRNSGPYAVYPGNHFKEHLIPFIKGGLQLPGATRTAAAVMTSYSIGIAGNGSPIGSGRVGTAYDHVKMDLLRKDQNFDGVVCTDWSVTRTTGWGVENNTEVERHYKILMAGSDMFGGNNDVKPVIEAYRMMEYNFGKEWARRRFEKSAVRILKLMLAPGLFENPYLDLDHSLKVVGNQAKRAAGYQAQLSSIVMVKNSNHLIQAADGSAAKKKVYIPMTFTDSIPGMFNSKTEPVWSETISIEIAKKYFREVITDIPIKDANGKISGYQTPDLSDVDLVLVGMHSPNNGTNFSYAGLKTDKDGNRTFYPLSLQYSTYTATEGRKKSIAGDLLKDGQLENRSYNGQQSNVYNSYNLTAFLNAKRAVEKTHRNIPMIACVKASNPLCFGEFEPFCGAIVIGFSVSDAALLDVVTGKFEPRGLLPMQMPQDMAAVEKQLEDVGHDLKCYTDAHGNVYDFAFGLNYQGIIQDKRVAKYKNDAR
ncbi:beta-glucosidase [Hydrogenispora ethanolica]|uniref:beta-glucosidase n=1 Tax=Hydrogenispora ethanolica TaxID=1082276 RepID=A0A4R1RZ65_HYDET|nr:glycoside hydrolase family 3 N-terminal domain-containing protein [Hydrogenispora ethanolica]TCL71540.1 beta-glucosidase [Hydrogenispora ethanolica]